MRSSKCCASDEDELRGVVLWTPAACFVTVGTVFRAVPLGLRYFPSVVGGEEELSGSSSESESDSVGRAYFAVCHTSGSGSCERFPCRLLPHSGVFFLREGSFGFLRWSSDSDERLDGLLTIDFSFDFSSDFSGALGRLSFFLDSPERGAVGCVLRRSLHSFDSCEHRFCHILWQVSRITMVIFILISLEISEEIPYEAMNSPRAVGITPLDPRFLGNCPNFWRWGF